MRNQFKLLLAFFFLVFLWNCQGKKKSNKDLKDKLDSELSIEDQFSDEFQNAKQVFYALPSPIETALMLKRAETAYNPSILNALSNVDLYQTSAQQALNFGVYGADLSYASLFNQNQTTIDYMGASKKLADELGMLSYLDKNLIKRLEANIANRDSSMEIITEGFMNSNDYLKENGRPETAALVIAGGWIEGLYIASKLTQSSPNNNELIDRIIDQKASLTTLIALLSKFEKDKSVQEVLALIHEIQAIYDQVQVVSSKVEPITDKDSKVTSLQAQTEIFISDEIFDNLVHKVDSIRELIVMP